MNYRHAFHAGNFADLVKHAAVILLMERLAAKGGEPLLVVDSHAGAGIYDLDGEAARKSGEAEAGVVRLMADAAAPPALDGLKAAVRAVNSAKGLRFYPGSPRLIADRLRAGGNYLGAELRPDDFAMLSRALADAGSRAQAVQGDGFALVRAKAADPRRLFVLIDPPFEQPDDYERTVEAIVPLLKRKAAATILIWLPLKDLETFDAFVRRLEALQPGPALAVEARLRPLTDPMKMNGCALVLLAPPEGVEAPLQAVADWVVKGAGAPGGVAKLWRFDG